MVAHLVKFFLNQLAWKTKRKLVSFEVDDYGSCQYNDQESLAFIETSEYDFTYFTKYDRLATSDDLERLFDILTSVKDANGSPAIFSPMVVATNPDYAQIRDCQFQTYCFEPFFKTISRIHGQRTIDRWREGIANGIFLPQYHGRQHMHLPTWLSILRNEKSKTRLAFNRGVCSFIDDKADLKNSKFSAAYGFSNPDEIPGLKRDVVEGVDILNKFCGYQVTTFTPPAGGYSYVYEDVLSETGIKAVSINRKHKVIDETGRGRERLHYFGESGIGSIKYTPRTALFEPHNGKGDAVDRCLRDIGIAFSNRLPAIISSHRINFVNQSNSANGDGLRKLKSLLASIMKKWPDAEFVSSKTLTELVHG